MTDKVPVRPQEQKGVRTRLRPYPRPRRHPTRTAACGLLIGMLLSALPAQIDWADGLGSKASGPDLATQLRLLTVSPTLLYADRATAGAYLHEALWAGLFLLLLPGAGRLLARKCTNTPDHTNPGVLFLALVTLAPVVHLTTMTVLALPELITEPITRGSQLDQLLSDAQNASVHAVLLALCGVLAASVIRRPTARTDTASPATAPAHPGQDMAPPAARPAPSPLSLRWLSGPPDGRWRRIGVTVLTAFAGVLVLLLLSGSSVDTLIRPFAQLACRVDSSAGFCTEQLVNHVKGPLPQNDVPALHPVFSAYIQTYALQAFAGNFAVVCFLLITHLKTAGRTLSDLLIVGRLHLGRDRILRAHGAGPAGGDRHGCHAVRHT